MKNLILLFLALSLLLTSCEKEEQIESKSITNTITPKVKSARWAIYSCDWDSWGHGSGCGGWGLCNYTDCWFCDNGDKQSPHTGQVIFDKLTKEGILIIKLDLSEQVQRDAIANKSVFYVDEDIERQNTILRKGSYPFDLNIGDYGGYNLNITVK